MPVWAAQLLSGFARVIGALLGLQNLVNALSGGRSVSEVYDLMTLEFGQVFTNANGLDVIDTNVAALGAGMIANQAALVALIAALPAAGSPVTLPVAPPSGYGYVGDSAIFNAVWNSLNAPDLVSPYSYVKAGGVANYGLGGTVGYRPDGGVFAYYYMSVDSAGVHGTFYPAYNYDAILASDTLLTWLVTANPTASCNWWSGVGSVVQVTGNSGDGPVSFLTVFDDTTFQAIKRTLGLVPIVALPPIWPGSALATLGTSVALDRTVTLTEVMDGVIVTLTSVPPGKPTYVLGGLTATAHIGQIAFVADNGAAEYPQNLSFASEIYVPLALVGASAAVLRTIPGVAGTVQAWTRTP